MTERKDVASNDDMPELKPCPFCGGRLVKQPIEVDGCCIYDHPKNNCILALKMITNHQVDKWNTRTDTLNQQAGSPAEFPKYWMEDNVLRRDDHSGWVIESELGKTMVSELVDDYARLQATTHAPVKPPVEAHGAADVLRRAWR